EVEGFFKQQGTGSIIKSNDIKHVSHPFLRNKQDVSLQNYAQFYMWQFGQDLFVSWGKSLHKSDFLRNMSSRDKKLLKKQQTKHLALSKRSEKKEI
ncbi:unnamed protein product, partial [Sphenostylis stenocarpa]